MKKCYVLDTNVLIHDPNCLTAFEDNDIIIPFTVTEELDALKNREGIVGYSARESARRLLEIITQTENPALGYLNKKGGRIKIDTTDLSKAQIPDSLPLDKNDNLIIATAIHLAKQNETEPIIFVTKDVNCHIKARSFGLTVQDYQTDKVTVDSVYTGWSTLELHSEEINTLYAEKRLSFTPTETIKYPNQMIHITSLEYPKQSAFGRFDGKGKIDLANFSNSRSRAYGLKAQNIEQNMLLELLMDDNLPLVTVIGPAGTGKTILSLATSLQKTLEDEAYQHVTLVRPVTAAGDDIGFLPGDETEKLKPWMGSFYDAFERLIELKPSQKGKQKNSEGRNPNTAERLLEELRDRGAIDMKTFTYMRGRSFYKDFVIIDEAQQMTPHLVKLMLTRAGEGTKIVMIGDPSDNQIDSLLVDSKSNGLVYAVERLKTSPLTGHMTLSKVERSPLAEMAEKLL